MVEREENQEEKHEGMEARGKNKEKEEGRKEGKGWMDRKAACSES